MPYKSKAQSRFVHSEANKGKDWAKKFIRDSQHGKGSVSGLPSRLGKLAKARAKRRA